MESVIIEFKKNFIYRSDVLFSVFGSMITILVQIALWKYLYRNEQIMINYMMCYVIVANIISIIYSNRIYNILSEKIHTGNLVFDLIRPMNILVMSYLRSLGEVLAKGLLQILPLLLVFSPIMIRIIKYQNIFYFILAVACGHILFTLIYAIIGFSSFLIVESWAFRRLIDDTIRFVSGAVMPLAIFPAKLAIVAKLLPFHYLYDFPLQLLLEDHLNLTRMMYGFGGIITWIIILSVVLYFVYKISIKHCVVQGG